jgi:hypothetical protein
MRARSIQSIASRFGHTLATDEGWGVPRTRLARRSRQSNPTHATGLTGVAAAAGEEEALVRGDVEAEQRRERGVLLVPVEGAGLLPVPLVPVPRLPVRLRRRARHRAPSLPPRCRPDLAVEPAWRIPRRTDVGGAVGRAGWLARASLRELRSRRTDGADFRIGKGYVVLEIRGPFHTRFFFPFFL